MIPKRIHYIWFGRNELGELQKRCISSWKRCLPDYEIIRWDESNFDISENKYCKEAYEQNKWAFASDYARLWVLVNYGGIYMDTDVEVISSFDPFLEHEAFSGFESGTMISTGVMASEAHHPLFTELLEGYRERRFINADGSLNVMTNVHYITEACRKYGFQQNNRLQTVGGLTLYPEDFFCPKDNDSSAISTTANTVAIHHFEGSWMGDAEREIVKRKQEIKQKHPACPVRLAVAVSAAKYLLKTGDIKGVTNIVRNKQ